MAIDAGPSAGSSGLQPLDNGRRQMGLLSNTTHAQVPLLSTHRATSPTDPAIANDQPESCDRAVTLYHPIHDRIPVLPVASRNIAQRRSIRLTTTSGFALEYLHPTASEAS